MRIALTHNLRTNGRGEETGEDAPETIDAIASALERLGHRVEKIEVSGPVSRTAARLEALAPDLVFNTAVGRRGRIRDVFYPALFEELGLAFTGSEASSLAVMLDNQTTKARLLKRGVFVPTGIVVDRADDPALATLRLPVVVKPTFEGGARAAVPDPVVDAAEQLPMAVRALLDRYPGGVLVEEHVSGRDVCVPFLRRVPKGKRSVLPPVEYVPSDRDPALKVARLASTLALELQERLRHAAGTALESLQLRDLGCVLFRVTDEGVPFFVGIDAQPSLAPAGGLVTAAQAEGMSFDGVVAGIVEGAVRRAHPGEARDRVRSERKASPLRVGFTFNVKRLQAKLDGTADDHAEYDSEATLKAIRDAISSFGHEVVDLEATGELPNILARTSVDVVFNMAEGIKGRSRESQVPALLDLLDVPYSGSDPATLAIALDKSLAKRMVRQHGILTPNFTVMLTGKERLPKELQTFPLIVKPNAEGSSKGVHATSVVNDEAELRDAVRRVTEKYEQAALVEQYISGREFTVGLLGERRPKVLPVMEIVFLDPADVTPVYGFAHKQDWNEKIRYDVPAKLDPAQQRALERAARECFTTLHCRDVARIDFRMDAQGRPYFLECNPLPGLAPGWSDLCLIADAAGMTYRQLVGEILAPVIRRHSERERHRRRMAHASERDEARVSGK